MIFHSKPRESLKSYAFLAASAKTSASTTSVCVLFSLEIITSYIFTCAGQRTTHLLHAAGHADVWQWHFLYNDHSITHKLFGDYHTNESKFIFGPKFGHYRGEDKAMQELIQGYWLNFVLDGNPNGAGNDLFHWERSSPEGVLIIKKHILKCDF